jgi:hypothetical protein
MGAALAVTLLGAPAIAAGAFSHELPADVEDISGWERVTGDVLGQGVAARYLLYVNPTRQGLYQVIRYRIVPAVPSEAPRWGRSRYEKLVYNERPGRAHLRCFERIDDAAGRRPHWRELVHGTPEYDWEMRLVMLLMQLHRQVLLGDDAR